MTDFVLSRVEHGVGKLRVGDIIEWPFRSGHSHIVRAIDRERDTLTVANARDLPVAKPGRATLPEAPG